MTPDQTLILAILAILAATVGMFLWGRWRHDMVAAGALLACVLAGLVAPAAAFAGFGHPAVVTVACVLVLSSGLQRTGAVDALTRRVLPGGAGPTLSIAALCVLAAVLSAFMNNVGALALLMPVAVQIAGRLALPPGKLLMPLAFASILGGTTTLIGTPPNLIISGFRANQSGQGGFAMFDFGLAGVPLTLVGLAFIALLGWRLVPARAQPGAASFDTGAYLTEARVPEGSKAAGMRLREIELELDAADAQIVGLVRNDVKMNAPSGGRVVRAGDILVIEAEVGALPGVLSTLGLELEEAAAAPAPADSAADAAPEDTGAPADDVPTRRERADDLVLMELVVRPESALAGRSASDLLLLDTLARGDAVIGLALILVTTMVLTDLMNNAATAAVMAPIGMGAAAQLGVNPDTFLMAVAIGASCAFLTPIGHQNNTLILGPGGFRFGDYWRMGLPLDAIVIAVALPALLLFWPLQA